MKPTGKTYTSVVDMLRDMGIEEDAIQSLEDGLRRTNVVSKLSVIRSSRGIPIDKIADAMGVTSEEAMKIDNKYDEDLSFDEIAAYVRVLGPTPGTWAWACERMLEGKVVGRACGQFTDYQMKLHFDVVCGRFSGREDWNPQLSAASSDLTATDWRVVETGGG